MSELIAAVKRGDADAVGALSGSDAELEQRDEHDWTALCWAAGSGDLELVELLLAAGADPLAAAHGLRLPYDIALAAGHVDAARRLRAAEEERDPAAARRRERAYCKAYELAALRRFPGWSEPAEHEPLAEDTVVFVHQDLTVTRSMWHGEDVLFADDSAAWREFCRDTLAFRVPDDLELVPASS